MSRWKFMQQTALLLAAMSTVPADAAVPIKMVGFEDMSCRAWSASKNDAEQRALYVAWVRGVLSGHNYANQSQQVSAISNGTVEQYVHRYCTEKPLGQFSEAAFRLSDQFSGRNSAITK
ncbi:conserved exported hypothetical protein [Candidatus Accumulibacter aalborgensis]|uniref:Uncharacterized protein n=1 Tax=Candidatus Accumulibacter aalborgensis TaxID=1860102 RepID=A0A1A8XRF7_9PROT|nr:hypothetical protein [Candidatus Accumulibacter aalborgensis]SBT07705.1 conserved exported hypothetical protein [Candidatus Accumulibacter aalborgensis]